MFPELIYSEYFRSWSFFEKLTGKLRILGMSFYLTVTKAFKLWTVLTWYNICLNPVFWIGPSSSSDLPQLPYYNDGHNLCWWRTRMGSIYIYIYIYKYIYIYIYTYIFSSECFHRQVRCNKDWIKNFLF